MFKISTIIILFSIYITWKFNTILKSFIEYPPIDKNINDLIFNHSLELQNIEYKPITLDQINLYHKNGYLLMKESINEKTLNYMKQIVNHVMENPNGMLKNSMNTEVCGFALHIQELLPFWRKIAYNLHLKYIASQLFFNLSSVVYSQEIFHDTPFECVNRTSPNNVGDWHSDQTQSPFSIEKKNTYGDNMVVAWIALDNLKDKITLDVMTGSHLLYNPIGNSRWNITEYYDFWRDMDQIKIPSGSLNHTIKRITLLPGDVLLFQGLTFHRVVKTINCKLGSCRRITVRYLNGENTKWRSDIPSSWWPFIYNFQKPDKLIAQDLPVVVGIKNMNSKWYTEEKVIPSNFYWIQFFYKMLKTYIGNGDMREVVIQRPPHKK